MSPVINFQDTATTLMVYTTHGGFCLHLIRLEEYLSEKSAQKANALMANGSLWFGQWFWL